MTEITIGRPAAHMVRRVSGWVARKQDEISDRAHGPGDAYAREAGWTQARTTGALGFGARIYHDPRFDTRRGSR